MILHMDITSDQYWSQVDYIIFNWRWRNSIQSAKISWLGADCGSDQHLIAKFRLTLKKVEKTTRTCRYDLNQTPYNYTVQVTNRFKGLDLIDRVPEEWWTEVHTLYRRQWPKPSPRRRMQEGKLFEETLQIAEERREVKSKGERERYSQLHAEFQRIARRDKKASSMNRAKK